MTNQVVSVAVVPGSCRLFPVTSESQVKCLELEHITSTFQGPLYNIQVSPYVHPLSLSVLGIPTTFWIHQLVRVPSLLYKIKLTIMLVQIMARYSSLGWPKSIITDLWYSCSWQLMTGWSWSHSHIWLYNWIVWQQSHVHVGCSQLCLDPKWSV